MRSGSRTHEESAFMSSGRNRVRSGLALDCNNRLARPLRLANPRFVPIVTVPKMENGHAFRSRPSNMAGSESERQMTTRSSSKTPLEYA